MCVDLKDFGEIRTRIGAEVRN